jgi:hypothetical protein
MHIVKKTSNNLTRINNNTNVNKEKIHYLPSIVEWQNSYFVFNKNLYPTIAVKDKIVHYLLNSYFNSIPDFLNKKRIKRKWMSLNRIFISKPNIKHNLNEIVITIYTFNKQKLFLLNKIKKLFLWEKINVLLSKKPGNYNSTNKTKYIFNPLYNYVRGGLFINKFLKFNTSKINNYLFKLVSNLSYFNTKNNNLILSKIINQLFKDKLKKVYLYKYYTSLLYINSLKFNITNLIGVTNILSKIYNKKVTINVINLRYLFLDNSIFAEAVVRKLNDRKKRILKVLRRGLNMVKKAKLNPMLLIPKTDEVQINNDNSPVIYKDVLNSQIKENREHVFKDLNNKYLIGVKLQGAGRLTKRLTASRSMLKFKTKGSLKNIYSSYQKVSTVMLKGHSKSNVQYININSKSRNGSFGIKSWLSSF